VRTHELLRTPGRTRVTALAFAVTLLAGCSSSTAGAPSSSATSRVAMTESTSETATDASAEDDSDSLTAADPSAGDSDLNGPFTANPNSIALTAAGTNHSFGQSATVPMASASTRGVITFGNFSLTQGGDADWTALEGPATTRQAQRPGSSSSPSPWNLAATGGPEFSRVGARLRSWRPVHLGQAQSSTDVARTFSSAGQGHARSVGTRIRGRSIRDADPSQHPGVVGSPSPQSRKWDEG
jgi:hypothetical protein